MIFNGNPIKLLNDKPAHITHNPELVHEYKIIRQCKSDGTMAHAYILAGEILDPILKKESTYKLTEPENWHDVVDMRYEIGNLKIEMGIVPEQEINPEKWWLHTLFKGELPVKVTYIMKKKK